MKVWSDSPRVRRRMMFCTLPASGAEKRWKMSPTCRQQTASGAARICDARLHAESVKGFVIVKA